MALEAGDVIRALLDRGFGPFVGVPCSMLGPMITWFEEYAPDLYLPANNEGEAVAIAVGAQLAGRRPVVMIQNSGLGNAVNPLTSLCDPMLVPILILVTWRGEPDRADEPQHRLMGAITRPLLNLMRVEHAVLAPDPAVFDLQLGVAVDRMRQAGRPYALVVPAGTIRPAARVAVPAALPPRRKVIASIMSGLPADVLVAATTGKTARELASDWDRPTNLYLVGSMGCVASVGLGMALGAPDRPVVVLDGDGAALMRLEALVTVGARRPDRLVHVLLDNGAYESTGGQRTNAPTVDFSAIAKGCGYASVHDTDDPEESARFVRDALGGRGPHFLRVGVAAGSDPGLGRPTLGPADAADRLRAAIVGAATS
ncbi:phosphonopyruvate decarboxylase [Micromonospora aurantiaca]|uniref:phosphonopyruvate decarboxylase n=1 Tax=Micromonospora aurantiaca (nom. illeg.) TaxID=47850 RepID=UPI0034537B0D